MTDDTYIDGTDQVKNRREIRDRIDGCILELDANLHPHSGKNPYRAAVLQGWIFALAWAIGDENPYDRSNEIRELLDQRQSQETDNDGVDS